MTDNDNLQTVLHAISGQSCSFDMGVAAYFGSSDVAVVFNHVRFWLKNNKAKGINQIEDRTWMYETSADMARH